MLALVVLALAGPRATSCFGPFPPLAPLLLPPWPMQDAPNDTSATDTFCLPEALRFALAAIVLLAMADEDEHAPDPLAPVAEVAAADRVEQAPAMDGALRIAADDEVGRAGFLTRAFSACAALAFSLVSPRWHPVTAAADLMDTRLFLALSFAAFVMLAPVAPELAGP